MTKSKRFWPWATVLYMAVLMAGSLRPNLDTAPHSQLKEMLHNFFHFPAYAMLTFILIKTFLAFEQKGFRFWVFLISAGYGGLIEILQGFVPGRTPSWGDESVNTLGTLLVLIFFKVSR